MDPEDAWNWKKGFALSFWVPLTLASSFLSKMFLNILDVCEPGEAFGRDGYETES